MPVSKKRKPRAGASGLKLTAAIVPTRRQREDYVHATTPAAREASLDAARAIIAKSVFNERPNAAIARAYQALSVSPLCVDAYVMLYAGRNDPDTGRDYLQRGVHAGKLALQGLAPRDEAFWQHPEAMPTMRARVDLALHDLDDSEDAAIAGLQQILADDPADHVTARYALLDALLNQDDAQPARDLLDRFPDDRTTEWLYGKLPRGLPPGTARRPRRAGPHG